MRDRSSILARKKPIHASPIALERLIAQLLGFAVELMGQYTVRNGGWQAGRGSA